MTNFLIDADSEEEMRQVLSYLDLPEIIKILKIQTNDMPPEQQKFYLDEIELWGAIGDKQQLISNIINIAEEYVGLEEVMEVFEVLTEGLPPMEAQTRFMTKGVPEGFEWSEETSPEERLKWLRYYQYPGYYSREEKQLIQPHPEQDYADPDLLKREWEEGKILGLGPVIPSELPKLEEVDEVNQAQLKRIMEQQITSALNPPAHTAEEKQLPAEERRVIISTPRPYVMEMVYDYLYISGHEAEAEKFLQDGVSSRSRFGFSLERILKRMFDVMPLEDLYLHWNSIVNNKTLPWVNENYVKDRFGGGAMGANIEPLYQTWLAESDVVNNQIEWPESVEWVERVPPAEANQWEY